MKKKTLKELEKLDLLQRRSEVAQQMLFLRDVNDNPLFDVEWVKEHILKIESDDNE